MFGFGSKSENRILKSYTNPNVDPESLGDYDYELEKLHLNPYLDHYQRGTESDLKRQAAHLIFEVLLSPQALGGVIETTSVYGSLFGEASCMACKGMTKTTSFLLSNPLSHAFLVEAGRLLCELLLKRISGFKADTCPGIIRQQWGEQILPMITDQLLDEQNMCTFIMNLCDMDKWHKVDVKAWIDTVLMQKPEITIANDYINNLYKENAKDFGKPARDW